MRPSGRASQLASIRFRMPPLSSESIPIYSPDGQLVRLNAPVAFLEANEGHFRIIRNRRGHIKRAYLRPSALIDRPIWQGNAGQTFVERLAGGWVWSMVMPRRQEA
jgi:hypothetical protein